jgi:hypothetical protein
MVAKKKAAANIQRACMAELVVRSEKWLQPKQFL